MSSRDFVLGIPVCNEPEGILRETIVAIQTSTIAPERIVFVFNGERGKTIPWSPDAGAHRRWGHEILRPRRNIGCAGAWNLIHKISAPMSLILLNADCAVAPDTFERMLDEATLDDAPRSVFAYAFGCFLVTEETWDRVGEFDEGFHPAYFEDADYRRRMRLSDAPIVEWPTEPSTTPAPGRARSPSGITHGSHDPDGYQGWRGDKLAWFWQRYEANRARYVAKWGGEPEKEVYATPFDRPR